MMALSFGNHPTMISSRLRSFCMSRFCRAAILSSPIWESMISSKYVLDGTHQFGIPVCEVFFCSGLEYKREV